MAVSRRLRFEVLRRDGFRCRYCGATPAEEELEVDHVIPETLGGSDDPTNLVTACKPCNSGKASVPPDAAMVDDVSEAALRWAAAMQEAGSIMASRRMAFVDARGYFEDAWDRHAAMRPTYRLPTLPPDWGPSIDRFVLAGLHWSEIDHLVEAAMASRAHDVFRYFCGVVWNHLREKQTVALAVVDTDPTTWVTQQQ